MITIKVFNIKTIQNSNLFLFYISVNTLDLLVREKKQQISLYFHKSFTLILKICTEQDMENSYLPVFIK